MGKKTLILASILILVMIAVIWIYGSTYHSARKQYNEGHSASEEIAKNEGNLTVIDDVATYNADQQYHIISGRTNSNDKIYVWVPQTTEEKNKKIIVKKQEDGITSSQALKYVQSKYEVTKLISVKIGMDNNIPIWEVKYRDELNRYTFDYVQFSTGEIIKHMALKNLTSE
ncbi:DUF5590 domain-containing protein [Bacillus weihaiensis]|uniref:Cell wall elongation regulator TseB-like domain-containing protein n=1 Tax=Bacillus weihaiensis TaxID=1547283 RepID=A0A1L3MQK9_9BACI|nr:DUF5590 domain-containing protein [Bacillus weihaiensis]APH04635.1 hypothetical protein A9C19_07660 [Bacillus weihaiensis]